MATIKTDYFSPAKPRIFAHRGLTLDRFDENSLEALKAAEASGIAYFEIDVRASSDGVVYVLHDVDLLRVAGVARKVAEVRSAELDAMTLKRGGKPLRLADAFDHFPAARFNIDLKTPEVVAGVRELVTAYDAAGKKLSERVLLTSFTDATARSAIRGLNVATSAGMRTTLLARLSYFAGPLLGWLLRDVDALQLPVEFAKIRLDSQGFIRAVQHHGVEVHYWTINDPAEAKRLIGLGADGIVSDQADVIAAALAE